MFNRSAIMKAAWARFRNIRENYAAWQIAKGLIFGATFAECLATEWRQAKKKLAEAAKEAKLALAMEGTNGRRVVSILDQLDCLRFKSFHVNIDRQRADLEGELAVLIAA